VGGFHPEPCARDADHGVRRRVRATIKGRVQGVGFRPTVWRHATTFCLGGTVRNCAQGVLIEVEGSSSNIDAFLKALREFPPRQARIESFDIAETSPAGETEFRIVPSHRAGDLEVGMPPDLATCAACRDEIFDPRNRRYRYPFTNCTNCGPRFTIIHELPYDRAFTSMSEFELCPQCAKEFNEPRDRRFDAQPNACADCGPTLRLIDKDGRPIDGDPIRKTAVLLRDGAILALKGLGGYHLVCLATSDAAVAEHADRKVFLKDGKIQNEM